MGLGANQLIYNLRHHIDNGYYDNVWVHVLSKTRKKSYVICTIPGSPLVGVCKDFSWMKIVQIFCLLISALLFVC